MYEKKTEQIAIRLGENTLKEMDMIANMKRRTRADYVRILIEDDIERHRSLIEEKKKEQTKNQNIINNSNNFTINNG